MTIEKSVQSHSTVSKSAMETGDHGLLSVAEVKNGARPKSLMSRIHILLSILTILTLSSFMEGTADNEATMTMTLTPKGEATIYLAGTGAVTIDWGDGSAMQTHELSAFDGNWSDLENILSNDWDDIEYRHTYSTTSVCNIKITGENITRMDCILQGLTSLDVSNNTTLIKLDCSDNQLTSLDVSKNTALKELECAGNQLTSLDVSKNTALTKLTCSFNQITSLDVSKNTVLTELICFFNQLASLDVSKNTMLTYLVCDTNQLSTAALNALFGTLHSNALPNKKVNISDNPGTNSCNRTIATSKGWTVK